MPSTTVTFDVTDSDFNDGTAWELVVRTFKPGATGELDEGGCAWVGSLHFSVFAEGALALEPGVSNPQEINRVYESGGFPGGVVSTGVFTRIKLPCYQNIAIPTVPPAMSSL